MCIDSVRSKRNVILWYLFIHTLCTGVKCLVSALNGSLGVENFLGGNILDSQPFQCCRKRKERSGFFHLAVTHWGEGGDSFEKASRWLLLRARPFCLPMDEVELMSRDQVCAFKKSPIQINSMADRSKYNIYCLQNQNLSFWKSLWPGQHGYGALYHRTKERCFFSLNTRLIF